MNDPISARQFHETEGVQEWRVIGDGACAYFRTGSFAASARLVRVIGELPGIDAHAPDVDVRPEGVTVRLLTFGDDYYGMSQRDVDLARRISAVAREFGFAADPTAVQSVLIVVEALATPGVMPFWRAVLGYRQRPDSPDEDLVDDGRRGPPVWFEALDAPRAQRNTIHLAVWVPPEQAEARVAAALAAGGHVVRDQFAPMWWTLADAEGNECDVSTVSGRD